MRDTNQWMSELLAPLDVPMCEAPMPRDCPGAYCVWQRQKERIVYASGKPFLRHIVLRVTLLLIPSEDAEAATRRLLQLLDARPDSHAVFEKTEYLPELSRRAVAVRCTLMEESP